MPKYRKKPIVIEAIQYDGNNAQQIMLQFALPSICDDLFGETLEIETLEGTMTASKGDYIIKGIKGELYPCKPDIFEASYEEVINDDHA